ncbi:DUF1824 family protein [Phormidium tenue FACHB-886]|nr:DUF1824 family protein [Phormidium tenue FACHB-886]
MSSLEAAHSLLKAFDCLTDKTIRSQAERQQVRQALLQVAQQSDYQILGVCSESFAQGYRSLQTYAAALGYETAFNLQPIEGVVYFKFNPKAGSCYVSPYEGNHRGVLVACQSAYESGVNDIYGHLPLDLFED